MTKSKKPKKLKPKFLTFNVTPKVVVRPRARIIKLVKVSGKIETTSNKGVVDFILITPKGKKEKSRVFYGKTTRGSLTVLFNWFYYVYKNTELGVYTVKARLRENNKQRKSKLFRVK